MYKILISAFLLLFLLSGFRDNSKLYYDPAPYNNPAPSGGCGSEGSSQDGSDAKDTYLNRLKNRDIAPEKYTDTDLKHINSDLLRILGNKSSRAVWKDEWKKYAARFESKAVRVYGYIDRIEKQGKEACNCYTKEDVDHHIWFGSSKKGNEGQNYRRDMVVELSPRLNEKQGQWPAKVALIKAHRDSVRISGWLMYDNEHFNNLLPMKNHYTAADYKNKTRSTLWEVHPIHNIEIWKGGKWRAIDKVY